MRIIVSSTMALSLFIHALLGCCCHHAHDACGNCESPLALAADSGCCHHEHAQHDDHGDKQHGQPAHDPCDGHSSCQGICHFLPVQKTQLDKLQSLVLLDFAAIVPAVCDTHVATLMCLERTHETPAEPPLRLHLFHQILLI